MATVTFTVAELVGMNLRRFREQEHLTQDDIAQAAQRLGLAWVRSSVGMLESGKRNLSSAELLVLPLVADEARRRHGNISKGGFGLDFFLHLAHGQRLALTETIELTTLQAAAMFAPDSERLRFFDAVPSRRSPATAEAEIKAAQQLGVDVDELQSAAEAAWGRSLIQERERRLDARGAPRSDQAQRGHITRELLDEIVPFIEMLGGN